MNELKAYEAAYVLGIAEEGFFSKIIDKMNAKGLEDQKCRKEFEDKVKNDPYNDNRRLLPKTSKGYKEWEQRLQEYNKQEGLKYRKEQEEKGKQFEKKNEHLKPQIDKIAKFAKKLYEASIKKYDSKNHIEGKRFDVDYRSGHIIAKYWSQDGEYKEYDNYEDSDCDIIDSFYAAANDDVDKLEDFIEKSKDIDSSKFRCHYDDSSMSTGFAIYWK